MSTPDTRAERLAREIEHDRRISGNAEDIWNWDSPAGRKRADRRAALFIERAPLAPGRRALELGCGTGVFLERVAPSGAEIHAIELSFELLVKARQRLGGARNVFLHRGNAEHMPFPDGTFDAVYGSSVLHHLDLPVALGEARRVLRPGGRIVFAEPNIFNPQIAFTFLVAPRQRFGLSPDEMAFSRFYARSILARVGFVNVAVRPFDFLHPSIPRSLVDRAARLVPALESVPGLREIAGSLLIVAEKPAEGARPNP